MFMHFRCATKQLPCKHRAGVKERSGGEEWVAYWKLLPTAANPLGILSLCCLAGWLPLACCPIPCLISACSMPVATRSLPASACSLSSFLPPMLLLLLISLLPPLLPHSCILLCLLFCFIPASSPVSSRAYPSLFSSCLLCQEVANIYGNVTSGSWDIVCGRIAVWCRCRCRCWYEDRPRGKEVLLVVGPGVEFEFPLFVYSL